MTRVNLDLYCVTEVYLDRYCVTENFDFSFNFFWPSARSDIPKYTRLSCMLSTSCSRSNKTVRSDKVLAAFRLE